ncbi:hypothetical protein ACFV4X_13585 [Streptomyces ardesiacus]|uniref:hypothetical protein n=1 Tax=Streptomyces ardesiacus TaxID=285564 RepID=UPI0036690D8D
MDTGPPPASAKSQIFEAVPGFLPDRVQITVLALVVRALVASGVVRAKRALARRRARRTGRALPDAAHPGQGTGADHLGPWAPPRQGGARRRLPRPRAPARRQERGADLLGSHAPPQQQGSPPARRRRCPARPSGRWTGDRVPPPDVGGSEAADRGRAPGRTVAYTEKTRTRGIPGREH